MQRSCLFAVLGFLWYLPATHAADLAAIERKIDKEPHYQRQPKYALVVFGAEAKFKVWLVLDGEMLYADINGDGDLTEPGKRLVAKKEPYRDPTFNVGDITVGSQVYKGLRVYTGKLKNE